MAKRTLLLILIILAGRPEIAWTADGQSERIEDLFESISEEFNELPDLDLIEFLSENPIYLPEAGLNDIAAIPGFTNKLAEQIIFYANKYHPISIKSIADSLNLTNTQRLILEICTATEQAESTYSHKDYGGSIRLRSQHQLSKIKGYDNGNFPGQPVDLLQRYYVSDNNPDYNLSAGILMSKDPGETSLTDYYSGFISYEQNRTKIIAGDYYLKAGLGTLLWNNFGIRKGIDVTPDVNQTQVGILPYRSSMDISFFRGVCLNQEMNLYDDFNINVTGFASSVNRSAAIDEVTNAATALYRTGLYRTKSEISKKNTLGETAYGGNIELELYKVTLGYTALNLNYSKPVYSESASAFYGKGGMLGSVYSSISLNKVDISA